MSFLEDMSKYKSLINEDLYSFFDEKEKQFGYSDEFVKKYFEVIKDYTMRGGKRLRAILPIMVFRAYSGDLSDEKIVRPSLSFEFMESYLLIHDDLIDDAPIRRGKITPHLWFANWYKENMPGVSDEEAAKFGKDAAVVAGDLVEAFAEEAVLQADFPPERIVDASRVYTEAVNVTNKGQLIDIWFGMRKNKEMTEQEHFEIIDRKTVEYSVNKPILFGAALAGVSEDERKRLTDYAFPIGRAFQLQDDLLDYFADEKRLGKPVLTDLREGKRTIVLLKALENASQEEKDFLMSMIGKFKPSEDEVERVRSIVRKTGSYDYSQKLIKKYIEQGKKAVESLNCSDELKDFFMGFADFMATREY